MIKSAKNESCGKTVLPDRLFLLGQKWVETAKIGSGLGNEHLERICTCKCTCESII